MKRRKLLLICLALLILALGIFAGWRCYQREKLKNAWTTSKDLSVYFVNADAVADQIRNTLRNHSWRVTLTYRSHGDNMEDIRQMVDELIERAMEETDDPTVGDYIRYQFGGYDMDYSYSLDGDDYCYVIRIMPHYYTTVEQEEAVDAEVAGILSQMAFTKETPEAEKIRAIYNYVYDTVKYDRVHKKNPNYHLKTTAYAAAVQHTAVCQGYSVLMYRLLEEAGIDCRVVTGTAINDTDEEYHAWNLVRSDGLYYNLDVTWDWQTQTHDYYMKSDASFSDHIRDPQFADEAFYALYPMAGQDLDQ